MPQRTKPAIMNNPPEKEELKRTIGVFGLACSVVNMTIGAGIFVLPALAAQRMGAAAILSYFICGALIFLIALCFAEVGSKVTGSGGTYTYIETAFGPFAGFLANNIFVFGACILSDAAVANGLSTTLGYFFPLLDTAAIRPFFFLLLFGGLAYINIRGTSHGVLFIVVSTVAKLVPLLLLVAFGMGQIEAAHLKWKTGFSFSDVGATSLILFYAFLGIETVVSNSGEVKNPPKVIPWGLLTGLAFVLLLYVSIQVVTQGILGDEMLSYKNAPLTEVSRRLFGYFGITLITLGIAIAMLGSLSGEILAIPRVLFAGARAGIFPRVLGKVHARYTTPHVAIVLYTSLGYLLAVFGTLEQLAILASAASLLIYLGVVLASVRLRYKKQADAAKTFTVPGGWLIPALATLAILWLLSNLSRQEMTGSAIAILVLSLIYLVMRWYKQKQTRLPDRASS